MSIFSNPASAAASEAEAYIAAILELLGDKDPWEVLESTPTEAGAFLVALDSAQLERPEAPGKWSARHVFQHLADSDLVWGYRLRMVLAHDRPTLTGYDQDAWADRLAYDAVPASEALSTFTVLRSGNLRLLRAVPPEALKRVGVHVERGEESVEHMMRLYAGHDLVHLRQLERIRGTVS